MNKEVVTNKLEKKENKVKSFFITTLNGMAYGLFATLIIGTILGTIGKLFAYGAGNSFCDSMTYFFGNGGKSGLSYIFQLLTGAGIGLGVGLALKFDVLKVITLGVVGEVASYFSLPGNFPLDYLANDHFQVGDPLTIYLVCISVALIMKYLLSKKTPIDIILIPLLGAISGLCISLLLRYPSIYVTYGIKWLIDKGTTTVPFIMGIIVSVLMGMSLTAPISSAAIAAMIFTVAPGSDASSGLLIASGAAVVGCSTQMIGFMIQSRKDNNVGQIISVGIGTSMLQFKNIIKKPVIWLPTIIASAILGPISTCALKLTCTGASAGMGTAGLVGQIGTIESMGVSSWQAWVGVFVLEIIAPAILVFLIDLVFRKLNWIKEGDLKI